MMEAISSTGLLNLNASNIRKCIDDLTPPLFYQNTSSFDCTKLAYSTMSTYLILNRYGIPPLCCKTISTQIASVNGL